LQLSDVYSRNYKTKKFPELVFTRDLTAIGLDSVSDDEGSSTEEEDSD